MAKKSCPERLVEIFGTLESAAAALSELARKNNPRVKRLRRQAVHAWVKNGYIPWAHAGSVEIVTNGKIKAGEIISEADRARRKLAEAIEG